MEYVKEYPLIMILGTNGSGKTLYATYLAYKLSETLEEGEKIFANYSIFGLQKYKKFSIEDISGDDFPEWLEDGVMIIDEGQQGGDAYDFLRKDTRNMSDFLSQVRKYNLQLIVITQKYGNIAWRLRKNMNYIYTIHKLPVTGVINVKYWFIDDSGFLRNMKSETKDLREFFDKYNTKEKIPRVRRQKKDSKEKKREDIF